ncbi:hypothetical protein [Pseudomonas putida]|uniref:hypothetical protein n=1 Tax=Pseudomonas putida TaxID=303 RepID=UPI000951A38F|nr:hypothetical protein [Pseudomonas putida]
MTATLPKLEMGSGEQVSLVVPRQDRANTRAGIAVAALGVVLVVVLAAGVSARVAACAAVVRADAGLL